MNYYYFNETIHYKLDIASCLHTILLNFSLTDLDSLVYVCMCYCLAFLHVI